MARFIYALVLATACLEPTEIYLEISTDEPCATVAQHGITIQVGTPGNVDVSPSTNITTMACGGSLVVVPSGSNVDVGITVVMGVSRDVTQCDLATPTDCIVARRAIKYDPHHALHLPIDLQASCVGIACPAGTTCQSGQCVDDTIDPKTCANDDCELGDAGVDVGVDAPPPCSADLMTDPLNCGKCGFDCSGGDCSGGVCLLDPMAPASGAGGACIGVALDGVYYSSGGTSTGTVYKVAANGGTSSVVISGLGSGAFGIGAVPSQNSGWGAIYIYVDNLATQQSVWTNGPYSPVASDGTTVCAGAAAGPVQCSAGGGGIASNEPDNPVKIALAAPYGYVTYANGDYWRFREDVISYAQKVTTIPSADGIAVATPQTLTYVAAGAQVLAVTEPTDTTTVSVSGLVEAHGLAFDAMTQTLYVADEGTTTTSGVIWAASPGGTPHAIATGQVGPNCIAIDATAVYWLSANKPMKAAR